jgi:hypothetical protein
LYPSQFTPVKTPFPLPPVYLAHPELIPGSQILNLAEM